MRSTVPTATPPPVSEDKKKKQPILSVFKNNISHILQTLSLN